MAVALSPLEGGMQIPRTDVAIWVVETQAEEAAPWQQVGEPVLYREAWTAMRKVEPSSYHQIRIRKEGSSCWGFQTVFHQ